MQFNTTIPNDPLPNYHESSALKPSRDADSTPLQWKRNAHNGRQIKALSENVGRIYRELRKIRPRALGVIEMHPFKLYNVAPQYLANGIANTDAWRTFAISSGCVGARSAFIIQSNSSTPGVYNGAIFQLAGNGEIQLNVLDGTDGFFSDFGFPGSPTGNENADFQQENYGLAQGPEIPAPTIITLTTTPQKGSGPTQWLLSLAAPDGGQETWQGASWWAQIMDTPTGSGTQGVSAAIYGMMVSSATLPTGAFFPDGPNIIPLAVVIPQTGVYNPDDNEGIGQQFLPIQVEYDHVVNRFAAPYVSQTPANTGPFVGPQTYRGDWANDQLNGLAFYPGDVVVDSTQQVSGKNNLRQYLYIGTTPAILSTAPPSDTANWLQIGGLQ